ncbi:serine/arginine-rich splicing factor SC35-like [Magnolia sinica]|uniref:serine/arginine-rich splicing factor SC35-like n=1 Tax=Magnolia sinica TaxID=86752 RepID=UPI00265937C0|nr:serine/arginine-rich splicing factor SC35-like [Magnolia sinica]
METPTPIIPFTIFVANLTFDTIEDDLLHIFRRFGKLTGVFIPRDGSRFKSRGFAFIRFQYEQEAYNTVLCINGRRIDVRFVSITRAKNQKGSSNAERTHYPQPNPLKFRQKTYLEKVKESLPKGPSTSKGTEKSHQT